MIDKAIRDRVKAKLSAIPQVRRIASGLSGEGLYYLAVISKEDDPAIIPEKLEGISIGIRYIEDD